MMTPELNALAVAGLIQVTQFVVFSIFANLELGTRYTGGSRDFPPDHAPSKRVGRLQRALNNHFEGLILFTLAVVVVTLSHKANEVTHIAAWSYVVARILYVPAYALGLNPWRSLIWAVGFFATVIMMIVALL